VTEVIYDPVLDWAHAVRWEFKLENGEGPFRMRYDTLKAYMITSSTFVFPEQLKVLQDETVDDAADEQVSDAEEVEKKSDEDLERELRAKMWKEYGTTDASEWTDKEDEMCEMEPAHTFTGDGKGEKEDFKFPLNMSKWRRNHLLSVFGGVDAS